MSSTSASSCRCTTSAGTCAPEIDRIQRALSTARRTRSRSSSSTTAPTTAREVDLPAIEGIRLIRHAHNRGSGAARRTGTTAARGRIVVWTDVDMTYPNDEIPSSSRSSTATTTSSGRGAPRRARCAFLRVPAKWFIRKLASYLTETEIPDLNSGLRAFRRDVAMQYVHHLPAGFSCVTTLTMSFLSNGYSVKYVPIDYSPRAGTSKFHWWRDTKRYLLQVVRMSLSYNPLKVFLPVGLTLLDHRHGQARVRLDRQGLPARRQHAADPAGVVAGDHRRPARRPRRACHQAATQVPPA